MADIKIIPPLKTGGAEQDSEQTCPVAVDFVPLPVDTPTIKQKIAHFIKKIAGKVIGETIDLSSSIPLAFGPVAAFSSRAGIMVTDEVLERAGRHHTLKKLDKAEKSLRADGQGVLADVVVMRVALQLGTHARGADMETALNTLNHLDSQLRSNEDALAQQFEALDTRRKNALQSLGLNAASLGPVKIDTYATPANIPSSSIQLAKPTTHAGEKLARLGREFAGLGKLNIGDPMQQISPATFGMSDTQREAYERAFTEKVVSHWDTVDEKDKTVAANLMAQRLQDLMELSTRFKSLESQLNGYIAGGVGNCEGEPDTYAKQVERLEELARHAQTPLGGKTAAGDGSTPDSSHKRPAVNESFDPITQDRLPTPPQAQTSKVQRPMPFGT